MALADRTTEPRQPAEPIHRPSSADLQVSLADLVAVLDEVGVLVIGGAGNLDAIGVGSFIVLDPVELSRDPLPEERDAGMMVLTGTSATELDSVRAQITARRPRSVLLKGPATDQDVSDLGIPVVIVAEHERWSRLLDTVTRFVHHAAEHGRSRLGRDVAFGDHIDLFGLAKTLGRATGTLIAIEDDQGRMLAFSPYSDQADPIRRLSILGREPPGWHIAELRAMRVYERLRHAGATVELAPKGDLRRRLGTGIIDPADAAVLGTIWAQQTDAPFGDDLGDYLTAAAIYAARLISRTRLVHTMDTELAQRLLAPDLHPSLGSGQQLRLEPPEKFSLVGFESVDTADASWLSSAEAVSLLSLHASPIVSSAMVAPHNGRLFAILPGPVDTRRDTAWAERTVRALEQFRSGKYRAALSSSISAASVPTARAEVERVFEATAYQVERPVLTLADERTTVLLTECFRALPVAALLQDERLHSIVEYDQRQQLNLLDTAGVWLANHGDVAATARALLTHPNTVRYRLSRLEKISGYQLNTAEDRLLLQLQIRLWHASSPHD